MLSWRTWLPVLIAGAALFTTACEEDTSESSPDIPAYTVLSLPEPEEDGKKLVWSTSPGGTIIFDDPLASVTTASVTVEGTLDGDDEDIGVAILDSENPGGNGIQLDVSRSTSAGVPVANSIDFRIEEVATGTPCPTQTVVDTAYATGSDFSFTVRVDQSGATPAVSVWLTGDPAVATATYTSAAADCTAISAGWVNSIETRVAMGADSVSLTLVEF